MQFGMIGLGRMGAGMVRRLRKAGHDCVVYDRAPQAVAALGRRRGDGQRLARRVRRGPRAAAPSLSHGPGGVCRLEPRRPRAASRRRRHRHRRRQLAFPGRHRARRAAARRGLHYVDMGTSGGVWGLERGYCLMIGGEAEIVRRLDPGLPRARPRARRDPARRRGARAPADTAAEGYLHCGPSGAGHFVKMIHNGIEYGLMAAYAEGFNILKQREPRRRARTRSTPRPRRSRTPSTTATSSTCRRSPSSGGAAASSRRGCSTSRRRRSPATRRSSASAAGSPTPARGAGRSPPRTTSASRRSSSPRRSSSASPRAATPLFQNQVQSAMRFGFGGHARNLRQRRSRPRRRTAPRRRRRDEERPAALGRPGLLRRHRRSRLQEDLSGAAVDGRPRPARLPGRRRRAVRVDP